MTIPEIRIRHGWHLQNAFVSYMKMIPEFQDRKEPSKEEMVAIITNRESLWKPVGEKLLVAMGEITGLEFYKNLIDVYVVFGYRAAFSNPLTISIKYKHENFIDVLTHEILHNILTDNTKKISASDWAAKKFPEITDRKAINHIVLHAVHKEIYLSVLNSPERLAMDIEKCQAWPSYKLAWDIVERDGHKEIIRLFKESHSLA